MHNTLRGRLPIEMPPLPSPSTACDGTHIGGHDSEEADMFELPVLDDLFMWDLSKQPGASSYDLGGAASFLDLANPYPSPALPNDSLIQPDFRSCHRPNPSPRNEDLSASTTPENDLLLFSKPIVTATLFSDRRRSINLEMTAQLGGMFFIAEDASHHDPLEAPKLTCYRRNLWQCSGQVTLSQSPSYLLDDHGNEVPISELMASIVAHESTSGNNADIVCTSWKATDAVTGNSLWAKTSPPICALLPQGQGENANAGPFRVDWARLQFKSATANNGRRKGPQQHYVVQILLFAKSEQGDCIRLAEIQSSPIIVRGRSPRNFDGRKEMALPRSQNPEKRTNIDIRPMERESEPSDASSVGSAHPIPSYPFESRQLADDLGTSHRTARRHRLSSTDRMPRKRLATCHSSRESFGDKSPDVAPNSLQANNNAESGILNLSLFDDDDFIPVDPENNSPDPSQARPTVGDSPGATPRHDADDDSLYEYHSLELDDWSVPPLRNTQDLQYSI